MVFCLTPNSTFLPSFSLLRRPFWISRKTHLSKSDLYLQALKIKERAYQQSGKLSWSYDSLCCRKPNLMLITSAFRSSEGDTRMQVFEQEVLIDEDLELRVANGGLEATFNRLSKWLVSLFFCAIVILRHDAEAMWLLSGSVINTILATVLKRVLNQERPVSSLKSDPGMPSSHAQSIFFIAAYIIVSMMESLGVNALTLVLSSLVFAFSSYLSWLRVSQQYHTASQVLVGAILGSAFSVFWIWSWNAVMHEAYTSYLLVRICVALGAAGFSFAFAVYVVRNWLKDNS